MEMYFTIDDDTCLMARDAPEVCNYRVLSAKGVWRHGNALAAGYLYNGEIGADPITYEEAELLASQLGSTLEARFAF